MKDKNKIRIVVVIVGLFIMSLGLPVLYVACPDHHLSQCAYNEFCCEEKYDSDKCSGIAEDYLSLPYYLIGSCEWNRCVVDEGYNARSMVAGLMSWILIIMGLFYVYNGLSGRVLKPDGEKRK